MRKVLAVSNMTIDGNCDHTIPNPDAEIHDHYTSLLKESGVVLYGRNTFEKIEVLKGSTQLGYTAIKSLNEIPHDTHVVIKGAFFINAKLTNSGDGHAH